MLDNLLDTTRIDTTVSILIKVIVISFRFSHSTKKLVLLIIGNIELIMSSLLRQRSEVTELPHRHILYVTRQSGD